MQKKIIQLPHVHISYSQIQLWKHDPKRYADLYFNGNQFRRFDNSGLDFGKKFALALELQTETGDLLTDAALLLVPKYDTRDQEISVEVSTKDGWLKIIGRPDMLDSVTKNFYEIKTGKGKWTANKAQKHPQMVFYAMLIYLKHNVVLNGAQLVWIETCDTPDGIKPTGNVQTFNVTFTLQDILSCMAETSRVAKEIEIAWVSHVPVPEEVF